MNLWTPVLAVATSLILALTVTNEAKDDKLLTNALLEQIYNSDFGRNHNSSVIANFLHSYLDGLMVKYRSRVLDLHRRLACQGYNCNPVGVLRDQYFPETKMNMDQQFRIVAIQRQFSFSMNGDVTTVEKQEKHANSGVTLSIGVRGQPGFRIMKLQGPPYKFIYNNDTVLDHETACISSTIYFYEMWIFVTGSCEIMSGQAIIRVFMVDEVEKVMFIQLLTLKQLEHILLFIHNGGLYLLAICANEPKSLLFCWRNTEFQSCGETNVEVDDMKTVTIGIDTYFIAISKDGKRQVYIYKFGSRANSQPEFKLHQVIQECSANNIEISLLRGINFLAVTCLHDESKFFWWSGNQYLLWQIIPESKKILSWTSIRVQDETFLVAQSSEKLTGEIVLLVYQFEEGYFRKVDNVVYSLGIVSVKEIVAFQFWDDYFLAIVLNNTENNLEMLKLEMKITEGDNHSENEDSCMEEILKQVQSERHQIEKLRMSVEALLNEQHEIIGNVTNRLNNLDENVSLHEEISSNFYNKVQNLSENGTIHLKSLIVLRKAEIHSASGSVQDFDIVHLNKWALSKTRNQVINRGVMINGKTKIDHLSVSGMLNGFWLRNDNIAKTSGKVIFTKPQIFQSSIHALDVFVKGKINEIDLSTVVLRNTRQVISGKKEVEQLVIRGNLFLNKLNTVHFDELKRQFVTLTGTQTIFGTVVFKRGFAVNGRLDCTILNGVHFPNWSRKVLTVDTRQVITGTFIFEAPQTIDSVTLVGLVNGVRITPETIQNLNMRNSIDRFSERLTSVDGHAPNVINHFGDLTVDILNTDFINGIDVNSLLNSLMRKSGNQTFEGVLKFEEATFNEVHVQEDINGHRNLQEYFITVATDQNISTPLTIYGNVHIEKSADFLDGVKINGVDLSELNAMAVQDGVDQIIYGHKEFTGDIIVQDVNAIHEYNLNASVVIIHGDLKIRKNLQTDTVNGENVEKLFAEAITMENCRITGNVSFQEGFELSRLDWDGKINEVDVPTFLNSVVRLSSDEVITGEIHFEDVTFANDVHVQMMNNKNINEYITQIAQLDEEGKLTHDIIFRNGLFVSGNTKVDFLNGREFSDFATSVISKTKDQYLPGLKFIHGDISTEYMDVQGTINDVPISELADIKDNVTFTNKYDFQSFVHFNSLQVDGNVHHPNAKDSENLVIEEDVHFDEIRADKILMEKQVDGIHLIHLKDKVLSKSIPQILNADVIFEKDAFIDHLTVQSGTLQEFNFNESYTKFTNFQDDILKRNVFDENILLRFHKGLTIDEAYEENRVSNMSWLQEFSGIVKSNVVFDGNFKVKGKIEKATFSKHLKTKKLEVTESINDIPVSHFETSKKLTFGANDFSCLNNNLEHLSKVLNHSVCLLTLQKADQSFKNDIEYFELMTSLESSDDISILSLGANRTLLLLHHMPRRACDKCSNLVAYRCDWQSGVPVCNLDPQGSPLGTYNVIKTRYLAEKNGKTMYTVFLNGGNQTVIDDCHQLRLTEEAAVVVVQTPRILLTSFVIPTKAASDVTLIEGLSRKRTYLVISSFHGGLGIFQIRNGFPRYKMVQRLNSKMCKIVSVVGLDVDGVKFILALNSHGKIGSEMMIIYKWHDGTEKLEEVGNVAVPFARDFAVFDSSSGQSYIIVTEQNRIGIHEFDGKDIRLVQSIAETTLRTRAIKLGDVTYLTWVTEGEILHLWRWDEMLFAVEVSRAEIRKVRNVQAFNVRSELWMALAVSLSPEAAIEEGSNEQSKHRSIIIKGAAYPDLLKKGPGFHLP